MNILIIEDEIKASLFFWMEDSILFLINSSDSIEGLLAFTSTRVLSGFAVL